MAKPDFEFKGTDEQAEAPLIELAPRPEPYLVKVGTHHLKVLVKGDVPDPDVIGADEHMFDALGPDVAGEV